LADYGLVPVGDLPASSVDIQAADVNSALIGASGRQTLATVKVAFAGVLAPWAEVHAMDDDQCGPLLPVTLEIR
jgi:hypothetical protein